MSDLDACVEFLQRLGCDMAQGYLMALDALAHQLVKEKEA